MVKTNKPVKKIWAINSYSGNVKFKTSNEETAKKYMKRKQIADGTIYGGRWPLKIKELKVNE